MIDIINGKGNSEFSTKELLNPLPAIIEDQSNLLNLVNMSLL